MGSLIPPGGLPPACAQVYILDSAEQVESRQSLPWGASLNADILRSLGDMLQAHNVLVRHFKQAAELDTPNLQTGQTVFFLWHGKRSHVPLFSAFLLPLPPSSSTASKDF